MKKIIAILAMALMISGTAYAALSTTGNVQIDVTVDSDFGLELGHGLLDLGNVSPGGMSDSKFTTLHAVSNSNVAWHIDVSNTAMTKSGGGGTILDKNIKLIFSVDEQGDPPAAIGTTPFETADGLPGATAALCYTPNAGVENQSGDHQIVFYSTPIGSVPAGDYSCTVTFTMVNDGALP